MTRTEAGNLMISAEKIKPNKKPQESSIFTHPPPEFTLTRLIDGIADQTLQRKAREQMHEIHGRKVKDLTKDRYLIQQLHRLNELTVQETPNSPGSYLSEEEKKDYNTMKKILGVNTIRSLAVLRALKQLTPNGKLEAYVFGRKEILDLNQNDLVLVLCLKMAINILNLADGHSAPKPTGSSNIETLQEF